MDNTIKQSPSLISLITGLRYPNIPRLTGNPILGRLPHMFRDNGVMDNLIKAGELAVNHPSGMCYYWIGNKLSLLITKPEDIYQFKVKNAQNLSLGMPLLEKFAGTTMFTDVKEVWREKRELCHNAMYHGSSLKQLESPMNQIIGFYLQQLQAHPTKTINLRTFFYNFVIDIVTSTLLGRTENSYKANNSLDHLSDTASYLADVTEQVFEFRSLFKWMLPPLFAKWLFPKGANNLEKLKIEMRARYQQVYLCPHLSNIKHTDNLLQKFWELNSPKDASEKCADTNDIFGDSAFLLAAGVLTTVATFEFIIKLLFANPDKEQKLREQLQQHLQGQTPTMEALDKIEYLDMVIKETLRLYPPSPLFPTREVSQAFKLNNIPVYKGDLVIVSPYITHRLNNLWDKAEEFIPERFAEENASKITKYSYIPFSIGPRFCIGQMFALQEIKLMLAAMYSNYQIKFEDDDLNVVLNKGALSLKKQPIAHFMPLQL